MTMRVKASGVWTPAIGAYAKESGVWKQADTAWVKQNGVWVQAYSGVRYEFYALGSGQTSYPSSKGGVWRNSVQTYQAQATYNLIQFDQYGNMSSSTAYDLSNDQLFNTTTNSDRLVADLNAMANGQVFALLSFSDSSALHLSDNIPNAVYRVGGTAAIFGQPMNAGGAYMLLNEVGAQFQVYETYVGSTNNATNAAIYAAAFILNAKWVLG